MVGYRKKSIVRKAWGTEERSIQENAFLNLKDRAWLKKQVETMGKGKYLLVRRTVRTPLVKDKAFELSKNADAMNTVHRILNFAKKVPFQEVSDITAARFYAMQTADDIISGKPIPTFRGKRYGLLGCQTVVATAMALLRAAKPNINGRYAGKITDVRAVRTIAPHGFDAKGKVLGMPHTIISLKIDGVPFIADPFKGGYSFVGSKFIGEKEKVLVYAGKIAPQIKKLKSQGSWKEAMDPSMHGTNSFEAYVKEAHAAGKKIAEEMDLEGFLAELKPQL